jgi:hypothetical protein
MTIRRIALQASTNNLTQNTPITVDANGFLVSSGLLVYAYIQNISATDKILGRVSAGAGIIEEIECTAAGRALIDDADAATQRTTLGLGTIATQAANSVSISGGSITGITDLAIADGGTGASTAAAARLALGLVDALDRMPTAMLPTKLLHSYWHASYDEITVVAGTWDQISIANQSDYDPSIISNPGYSRAASATNNDEIHFGSLSLNAGTYKINLAYVKMPAGGIIEILHGTTSIGTVDSYAAALTYNQVVSFTYSPTTLSTGNFRIKATGKNASATDYRVSLSRLEIIRTG